METRIYLITGFLGSGKTTLLSRILSSKGAGKTGVIVNDFGKLGSDAAVLRTFEKQGVAIKELVNGQIFCSCLSPSFIQNVAAFKDMGLDHLIVEASGLAKPSSLHEILAGIDRVTGGGFDYRGMICVIDAPRYLKLSQNVNAINEQIVFSDVIIVNKSDLASEGTLTAVERSVRELNGAAVTLRASYCALEGEVLPEIDRLLDARDRRSCPACENLAQAYAGWGTPGRPIPYTILPESEVGIDGLREFLSAVGPKTYRIKGYLKTDQGLCYVDGIGESVIVTPQPDSEAGSQGLTLISRIGKALGGIILDQWSRAVRIPFVFA